LTYDVIVVGAGPAGSTVARRTAARGLSTCLIEQHVLPRYKPCGGGLYPALRRWLETDYSDLVERVATTVTFVSGSGRFLRRDTGDIHLEMVDRAAFDHRLVREAVRAGAVLREGVRVIALRTRGDHVEVESASGRCWQARIVVGADGAQSTVARAAALEGPAPGLALEAELYPRDPAALASFGHHVFFGFSDVPDGYGWVFPKRDHFSVGVASLRSRLPGLVPAFVRFKRRFPFLDGAKQRLRCGCRLPFNRGFRRLNTARVCLVGDAAGLVDPFTGEGIYHAVRSGILAADLIAEALDGKGFFVEEYTRRVNEELVRELVSARRLSSLFFRCPSLFYRSETMIRLLGEVASERLSYRELLPEAARRIVRNLLVPGGARRSVRFLPDDAFDDERGAGAGVLVQAQDVLALDPHQDKQHAEEK